MSGRLNYSNVMATIAVFVAFGGTSYAVATVTGKNVKNGSLTGRDVKNDSLTGRDVRTLTSRDVKDSSLLAKDFKSGQLPAGPRGAPGPRGPSEAYVAGEPTPCNVTVHYLPQPVCVAKLSLTLPPGDYLLAGKITVFNATGIVGTAVCQLPGSEELPAVSVPTTGSVSAPNLKYGSATLSVQASRRLPGGGTVTLECRNSGSSEVTSTTQNLSFSHQKLRAVRVGNLVGDDAIPVPD